MRTLRLSLTLVSTVALAGAAHAAPKAFAINDHGWSRVLFESDAPVENISGVTTAVSGTLAVDLLAPTTGASADVKVDLTQMKTGVDKRDEHMRSAAFLDTAKYPTATFQLAKIEITGDIKAPGGAEATGVGKLTLHGVTKDLTVKVKVGYRPLDDKLKDLGYTGDVLRVTGKFQITLSDFGVKLPEKLGLKVSNTVDVTIGITGVAK